MSALYKSVCIFAENSDGVRKDLRQQAAEESLPNVFSEFAHRLDHDGDANMKHEQTPMHMLGHTNEDEPDMGFPSQRLVRSMNRALLRQMFGAPTAHARRHHPHYWRWRPHHHANFRGRPYHTRPKGYQREHKQHNGPVI